METLEAININTVDFNKLSLESLCEIYAASFGMCVGYTNPAPLRRSLEYQREQGSVVFPHNPSRRLLNEL